MIAALVVAGVVVLGLVLGGGFFAFSKLTSSNKPEAAPGQSQAPEGGSAQSQGSDDGGRTQLADLQAGDCIADKVGTGTTIERVNCDTPHYGQIYAVDHLTDSSYPGESTLTERARSFCRTKSKGAVDSSKVSQGEYVSRYSVPNAAGWDAGTKQRVITCMIARGDGQKMDEDLMPSS